MKYVLPAGRDKRQRPELPRGPVEVEVPVYKLARGARFKMPLIKTVLMGTYVESTACSAKVILDSTKADRQFIANGKTVTVPAKRVVTYWWPGALVIPTGEIVDVPEHGVDSQFETQTGGDDMAPLPGVKTSAAKKVAGTVRTKKEKRAKVADHPCLCGCGTLCVGRFKSGHDGTFYKYLRDLIKGEIKMNAIPAITRKEFGGTEPGARAYLKNHGH